MLRFGSRSQCVVGGLLSSYGSRVSSVGRCASRVGGLLCAIGSIVSRSCAVRCVLGSRGSRFGEVTGLGCNFFNSSQIVGGDCVILEFGNAHTELGKVSSQFLDGILQDNQVGGGQVLAVVNIIACRYRLWQTSNCRRQVSLGGVLRNAAFAIANRVEQTSDNGSRLVAADWFVATESAIGEAANNTAVRSDLDGGGCPVTGWNVFEFSWFLVLGLGGWVIHLPGRVCAGLGKGGYASAHCGSQQHCGCDSFHYYPLKVCAALWLCGLLLGGTRGELPCFLFEFAPAQNLRGVGVARRRHSRTVWNFRFFKREVLLLRCSEYE